MLLNEEQIDDYRKTPLLDGLHEAARIGQTRKWQWPWAWLARPREALIHLILNGWHGKHAFYNRPSAMIFFGTESTQMMFSDLNFIFLVFFSCPAAQM